MLQGMKQQMAAFAAQISALEEQNQEKARLEQAQRELAEEQAVIVQLRARMEEISPGSGACACLFACSFACLFMGDFAADVLCILECGFVARGFVVIK